MASLKILCRRHRGDDLIEETLRLPLTVAAYRLLFPWLPGLAYERGHRRIDGVVVAQATRPQAVNNGTGTVRVGHANDLTAAYYVDGYIDEVAITKGLCLYASNFTPPAVPLALRTGGDITQLLSMPNPIGVNDTGRIRRDCTRKYSSHNSCETYWGTDKGLHFRGEPHLQPGDPVQVPGAET